MSYYNAVVIGYGNVGREVVAALIGEDHGLPVKLTGIASSRGAVIIGGPADLVYLHKLYQRRGRLDEHPSFREGVGPVEAAILANADVALIALPPNYMGGEPNRSIVFQLIEENVSIITADKTVPALDWDRLVQRVEEKNLYLGIRATVAAGTPAVDAARGLRYRRVHGLRAVLNATTNYILGLVEEGNTFQEAVRAAQAIGLAEPDPTVDTHGWDAAAKLVILSNLLGYKASLEDVERKPLDSMSEEAVRAAVERGLKVKYVAEADYRKGRLRVYPETLQATDPLARAEGEDNVIIFRVEDSEIELKGPAGPAWRTARVMITDLADFVYHARMVERIRGETL